MAASGAVAAGGAAIWLLFGGAHDSKTKSEATEITVDSKTVIFDDLGAGSNVIMVYPGVTRSPVDMTHNGTYFDGQTATADCQIQGRTVPEPEDKVDHTVKERSTWVHLKGGPGSFAVTVYLKGGLSAAEGLQPCHLS